MDHFFILLPQKCIFEIPVNATVPLSLEVKECASVMLMKPGPSDIKIVWGPGPIQPVP